MPSPGLRPVAASKFDALFTSRPIRKEAGKEEGRANERDGRERTREKGGKAKEKQEEKGF